MLPITTIPRGARHQARASRRKLVFGRSVRIATMMQSCASAAKEFGDTPLGSRGSDPRLLGLTVSWLLDCTCGERPALLAKPSPLNINLGSDRFSNVQHKAGHPHDRFRTFGWPFTGGWCGMAPEPNFSQAARDFKKSRRAMRACVPRRSYTRCGLGRNW